MRLHFKIWLNDYDNDDKCLLSKEQKKSYSVFCLNCKTVIFQNFDDIANENAVALLEKRQNLVRLRQKFKEKKTQW